MIDPSGSVRVTRRLPPVTGAFTCAESPFTIEEHSIGAFRWITEDTSASLAFPFHNAIVDNIAEIQDAVCGIPCWTFGERDFRDEIDAAVGCWGFPMERAGNRGERCRCKDDITMGEHGGVLWRVL